MTWLALSAALLAGGLDESTVVMHYREDPLSLRRELRRRIEAGESNARLVGVLVEQVGDHSLDDLAGPRHLAGLRLQNAALREWDRENREEAISLFLTSALEFRAGGGNAEALFSLYWAAAVLAEQERFEASLRVAATALHWRYPADAPLLEALLLESCGYALWLLDRLPEATGAFDASLAAWRRVGYRTALVAGHNNLAALAEALRLPERAAVAYRAASRAVGPDTHPEVALQLWRNWSLFEARRGGYLPAYELLKRAAPLRSLDPTGFALWEAQLAGSIDLLEAIDPETPTRQVEWRQVAGRIELGRERFEAARRHFQGALELARSAQLPLLARQAAEELGSALEKLDRFQEAEHVYRTAYLAAPVRAHRDPARPYLRLVAPLFSGWLRALAAQGRWREARARLHARARKRYESASAIRFSPSVPLQPPAPARGYVVVELWPADDRLLVWVDTARGTEFRSLGWDTRRTRLVDEIVSRFSRADGFLPPPPRRAGLRDLYGALIDPVADLLGSPSLLIVPHGLLQPLPFELLIGPDGQYLGDRFALSYLPSPAVPAAGPAPAALEEVLLASPQLDARPEAVRERRALLRLFPTSRQVAELPPAARPLRWLHVSTHLEVADSNWLTSTFETGAKRLTVSEFARRVPPCDLLTLGACDAAAAQWSRSPYWMGLSEILLAGGVRSLLVTRWKLDEKSTGLFVRFYAKVKEGLSLDRALREARRDFREQAGRRRFSEPLDHPFYWAGVAYVGEPGKVLYRPPSPGPAVLLLGGALAALFGIVRRRARQQQQATVAGRQRPTDSQS